SDDPPGTGGSLARVIRGLGVDNASVVLLLQLFDGQELPPALSSFAAVCLPWAEWAVHGGGPPLPAGRGHVPGGRGIGYLGRAPDLPDGADYPVREDFSLRMMGDFPAWEVASNVLSRAFGRAGPAVKLLAGDAAVRRLLHVQRPVLTSTSYDH